MAHPTAVILVVGLSSSLVGKNTPCLNRLLKSHTLARVRPVLPAVTCSTQATMLTGLWPAEHGIVGNGYYHRELAEVHFWKQSNRLIAGEKVWETARRRDPSITCANLFWWFNMYSSVDYSVTPRPIYKANGRKLPDVYTEPADLRNLLQSQLGTFPLFNFWGPASSIASSQWIARATVAVHQRHKPTLTLVYLPHLDYGLQKLGPGHPDMASEIQQIDRVLGDLLTYFEGQGVRVMIVSEYGIEPVQQDVPINRHLREAGLLRVRVEEELELLDPGASRAFAVADHQLAHVYIRDESDVATVRDLCTQLPGVDQVLDRNARSRVGLAHARAGDLVLVAKSGWWFSYRYWLDDHCAPDFARTVEIHRKPGYDPLELFLDPALTFPRLTVARKVLQKKLGMATLLDVIPLDTSLVRGSHGRSDVPPSLQPVLIADAEYSSDRDELMCWQVRDVILNHLFRD